MLTGCQVSSFASTKLLVWFSNCFVFLIMGDLHTLLATHLSSFEFQIEGSKLRASWGLGNVALGFERDFKVCTRPRRCLVWNYVCKLYPKYHLTLINLYCVSIKSQWRCLNECDWEWISGGDPKSPPTSYRRVSSA